MPCVPLAAADAAAAAITGDTASSVSGLVAAAVAVGPAAITSALADMLVCGMYMHPARSLVCGTFAAPSAAGFAADTAATTAPGTASAVGSAGLCMLPLPLVEAARIELDVLCRPQGSNAAVAVANAAVLSPGCCGRVAGVAIVQPVRSV